MTYVVGAMEELQLFPPFFRGIANKECIAICAQRRCHLAGYGMIVGALDYKGDVFPLRDHFFWFGDGVLESGDWIFVYTGPGADSSVTVETSNSKVHSLYWGKRETIFHNPAHVPVLISIDGVKAAPPPAPQAQSSGIQSIK